MLNFPHDKKYKIEFVNTDNSIIASNHKTKTLYISKDLKLNETDDGKLRATFPNFRPKPDGIFAPKYSETDCSVTISDPSEFSYCVLKDGEYRLSGYNFEFEGTDNADRLQLDTCIDSKIDLGAGDDALNIKSGSRPIIFQGNKIKTGNGDDKVTVYGDFKKFSSNEFYLGKGSDHFVAEINPQYDTETYSEFEANLPKYARTVSKNEVYAIDGYTGDGDSKGWFEKNTFESKTYSANQLSALDGFQHSEYKPEPCQVFKSLTKNVAVTQPVQTHQKSDSQPEELSYREKHERAQRRYQINSLLYNFTGKAEFAEEIMKASQQAVDACIE